MQRASDTPSSHFAQGLAKPGRLRSSDLVAESAPQRGASGHQRLAAKERVRSAAGAPQRYRGRHTTVRELRLSSTAKGYSAMRIESRKRYPTGATLLVRLTRAGFLDHAHRNSFLVGYMQSLGSSSAYLWRFSQPARRLLSLESLDILRRTSNG